MNRLKIAGSDVEMDFIPSIGRAHRRFKFYFNGEFSRSLKMNKEVTIALFDSRFRVRFELCKPHRAAQDLKQTPVRAFHSRQGSEREGCAPAGQVAHELEILKRYVWSRFLRR